MPSYSIMEHFEVHKNNRFLQIAESLKPELHHKTVYAKHFIALIGHSGSGDADISEKKPTIRIVEVFHGKTGGGYLTQFYPHAGPVTYLAITQDGDGHFKFIVAEGVNEEGKMLSFGDTNMRTRFTCGAREFVNRWSECGPTHHFAAASGRHIDTILKVTRIFNVSVEIVTR